jgi:hypothetical protein
MSMTRDLLPTQSSGPLKCATSEEHSLPVLLLDGSGNSLKLALDNLVGDALLALLEGLADTGNDLEADGKGGLDLVSDDLVGVAEERAALRVAENDPGDTGVLDLLGRDLAGEGSRVDEVGVLGSDLDGGLGVREGLEEVDGGRGDDDLCEVLVLG